MANNLCYVFDETARRDRVLSYCEKSGIDEVLLCPVTTNEKGISLAAEGLAASGKRKVSMLPYLDYFHGLSFSERDRFIAFIHDFGIAPRFAGKNLREYFKYIRMPFSAWWPSLIAEKNPFKSDSYPGLIKLLAITNLARQNGCGRIAIDIQDAPLSRAISDNAGYGGYECDDLREHPHDRTIVCFLKNFAKGIIGYLELAYKFFILKTKMRRSYSKESAARDAAYMAITYFPFVDKDALRAGRFVNRYYGPMQSVLENRHKGKFMWLALVLDMDGFDFRKSVDMGRKINSWGHPLFFIEEWLTFKDLLTIPAQYIYITVKFLIKVRRLSRDFKYPPASMNLWQIFKDDWFSSFSGNVLIRGLMHHRLFANLSGDLGNGSTVMYLAENQAWEKAMNAAFHNNKDIKTVGVIHSTAPLLFLPYFDFKAGSTTMPAAALPMPAPDYMACNGNVSLKLFLGSGWDRDRVFLWSAVRYQHLEKRLQEDIPWASRQNKILVSLTLTTANQAREMLLYIHEAFRGERGYRVVIKDHYAYPLKPLLKRLNFELDEEIFSISAEKIDELLCSVKVIVVSNSSVSLESVAFGCPVIIPRLSSVIDINPLSGLSDIPIYVNSPGELRAAVRRIIAAKESPVEPRRYKDLVRNYFEMTDDAEGAMAKFESHLTNRKDIKGGMLCPGLA